MPNWNDLLDEIKAEGSTLDIIRRKYLKKLNVLTGRNIIIYYSGWLQKYSLLIPGLIDIGFMLNDGDKIGFMTTTNKLDRSKGLDLILHTPGGEFSATESIVDYLRSMFGTNIRAIIPQIAMSGGTMIACACESIVMGKQSNLGPVDPQYRGFPAHGVIEEFEQAFEECQADQIKIPLWQQIIARYNPTLIGECQKAIKWSEEMVEEWLRSGMLKDDSQADSKIEKIKKELGDHALTRSHARHISAQKCIDMGLKVEMMEDDQKLQDLILSVHYSLMHTFNSTPAIKIIENQNGKAYIIHAPIPATVR